MPSCAIILRSHSGTEVTAGIPYLWAKVSISQLHVLSAMFVSHGKACNDVLSIDLIRPTRPWPVNRARLLTHTQCPQISSVVLGDKNTAIISLCSSLFPLVNIIVTGSKTGSSPINIAATSRILYCTHWRTKGDVHFELGSLEFFYFDKW